MIKSASTIAPDFFRGLEHAQRVLPGEPQRAALIYGGDQRQIRNGVIRICPVTRIGEMLQEDEAGPVISAS